MKEKKLVLEPRKCEHSVSPLYYKASHYPPICASCAEPLNEKHRNKLLEAQKLSDDISWTKKAW